MFFGVDREKRAFIIVIVNITGGGKETLPGGEEIRIFFPFLWSLTMDL